MTYRRFVFHAVKKYKKAKDVAFSGKHLFYTNVTLSLSISTVGDCLAQSYEIQLNEIDKYDPYRTAHMAFSGATAGVICHHWYQVLDKVIVGRTLGMAIKKLLLDQCVFSPIIILSFFGTVAIFEDNPINNFTDEVRDKFWTLYKAEWVVWPPAQIINFYFLPTKYRVLYDNLISLGYDIFTSRVKHAKSHKEDKQDEA